MTLDEKAQCPSPETNKAIVRRFIAEVWNAGELAVANELIHDDYAISSTNRGPTAVQRNIARYRAAFPDLNWSIEEMIAEGEWVAVRLILHGTHRGEFRGVPPTGKRVAMQELVFWRIVDGKLHTIQAQADSLGLRIQLGAIPATAWHQPVVASSSHADVNIDTDA